jgi:predicted transcriptional regulator
MSATTTCDNSKCSCDPCTCVDCSCGVPRLGELERRVMDVLWDEPGREVTGRQVADRLDGNAYTTVATVLDRLVHKDLVARRMVGRAIRFIATGTGDMYAAQLMHEALVTTDDPAATLASFAQILSRAEAGTLRGALTEESCADRETNDAADSEP